MIRCERLLTGFPARSSRGFLGWSSALLIRAGTVNALFDTGGAGDRPTLLSALAAHGVAPAQIDTVILSHLHFDHVANVECFPGAEVVLHSDELAYYDAEKSRDLAVPRYLVEGMLRDARMRIVEGEPDILPGVRMFSTPGHTGGHVSLSFVEDGLRTVLAQDALKHRGEVSAIPAGSFDPKAAAGSIARIVAEADVVVPGHDAPLRISRGRVTSAAELREDITFALDGRRIALEVAA